MAKRTPAKDQDKMIVRLPDGLRDRIKEHSEQQGLSMNEFVVRILEEKIPPPEPTLEERIGDIIEMASVLRGNDAISAIDNLNRELMYTITMVNHGMIEVPPGYREAVQKLYQKLLSKQDREMLRKRSQIKKGSERKEESS